MPIQEEFDTIHWINRKFNYLFTTDELNPVRDFTVMWNLFENRMCDRNFNEMKIRRLIDEYSISSENFHDYLNYFSYRYVYRSDSENLFNQLYNNQTSSSKDFVYNVLIGKYETDEDKIIACVLIVHRYRNNLFHGNKQLIGINHQRQNLNVATLVMATFMERIPIKL